MSLVLLRSLWRIVGSFIAWLKMLDLFKIAALIMSHAYINYVQLQSSLMIIYLLINNHPSSLNLLSLSHTHTHLLCMHCMISCFDANSTFYRQ